MALLGFDGFDHYNSAADIVSRVGFIGYSVGLGVAGFPTGRNGFGKCLYFENGIDITFGQRVASAFVGFAFLPDQQAGAGIVVSFYDSVANTEQCRVAISYTNYSVAIYFNVSGSWVLQAITQNNVFGGDSWNYFEFWPVISSTASGSVTVKINGQQVLTASGITQVSANAWWDMLQIGKTSQSYINFKMDDLYYGDTTTGPGSYPCNSPLGDVRTVTLFPVSNNTVAWTPLANTNYQEVDEVIMDSDASYNYTTTVGAEDLLNFGALTGTINKILGVQVTGAYRKDDAGTHTLKQALKSGTAEQYGATRSLPDTAYSYFTDLWAVDPNTGASWTELAVNNLAAGYNLVS